MLLQWVSEGADEHDDEVLLSTQNTALTFTQDQYHRILALLEHTKAEPLFSTSAMASHVSVIPRAISHTLPLTSKTGNPPVILSCSSDPSPFGGLWILDYGATDHICVNLAHFTSYFKTWTTNIRLPNRTTVTASYHGTITFYSITHSC